MAGHGSPSLAFRLKPNSGEPDGIARSVWLQGGVTYQISADVAQSNEAPIPLSRATAVHLRINGTDRAIARFSAYVNMAPSEAFRTNLMALFTPLSNGLYQLAFCLDDDPWKDETLCWGYVDNVRISSPPLVPLWTGPFTNGLWTGMLRADGIISGIQLRAEAPDGHQGLSTPFDLLPKADLEIQTTFSPSTPRAGTDLTLTLSLRNHGVSSATDVLLSNTLLGVYNVNSVTATQGKCTNFGSAFVCQIGTLTSNQAASVTISVRSSRIGFLTNTAMATSAVFDPNPSNNTQTTAVAIAPPQLFALNTSVLEGSTVSINALVQCWLASPSDQAISIDYTTAEGTAAAGADYSAVSGTLIFPPNVTTQFVSVPILGDLLNEADETLTLQFSNPTNVVLGQSAATIKILDDDPLPTLSIWDTNIIEGDSGKNQAVFAVTLSAPSGRMVSANWFTSNGTAKWNGDFSFVGKGYVSFPPGVTNTTVTVEVLGDTVHEGNEIFYASLYYPPTNAAIARWNAACTIIDDDLVPGRLDHFSWGPMEAFQLPGRSIPVSVTARDAFDATVTNFCGSVALSGTALTGRFEVVVVPTTVSGFIAGVWTGSVTLTNVKPAVMLKVDDSQGHTGQSSLFDVVQKFPLLLSLPLTATEGDGVLVGAGCLAVPSPHLFDTTFTLTTNITNQLIVPPTVLLPAGQTSIVFDLTVVDDHLLNGSQSCSVSASALNYVVASSSMTICDNESAILSILTPETFTEGSGTLIAAASLRVSQAPDTDVSVALTSSDTNRLIVPHTVIIPAGQTSATFNVTVPDDHFLNGPQIVAVTAHVNNWTDAIKSLNILDNENSDLFLQIPSSLFEGQGTTTNTGLVRIGGLLATNLSVFLFSSDTTKITVPASVIIPAGQTSAVFSVSVLDNLIFDGAQVVTVIASADGLGPASAIITVADNEMHHLNFDFIPSPQTSTVPFNVALTARDINDVVITSFNGTARLDGSGRRGKICLQPTDVLLRNGIWTGAVTIACADTYIRLIATSANLYSESNPFDIQGPAIQVLELSATDLVYNPFAQRIYAGVSASGGSLSNCLVVIDPVAGCIETSFPLGDEPGKLAISDDSRYLYIGFPATNIVRRFDLATQLVDLEVSLGWQDYYGWMFYASDLAALPGLPRSFAVLKATTWGGYYPTAVIFDDGVQRSNVLTVSQNGPCALEVASSTRMYLGGFYRLTIDRSGVAAYDNIQELMGCYDDMTYQHGLIFTRFGTVFDAESGITFGHLPDSYLVTPDLDLGRIYTLTQVNQWAPYGPWTLRACDTVTLLPIDTLQIPNVGGWIGSLIRWGTNGLAFWGSRSQVFLIRTPLVPPAIDLRFNSVRVEGHDLQMEFPTVAGNHYTLHKKNNLIDGNWTNLGQEILGTGQSVKVIDSGGANNEQGFYRIELRQRPIQ